MTLHKRAFDDHGGDGAACLERALRRFATAGGSRPQRRFPLSPNHDAFLRGLLTEMDETVLPRQLELICDTGAKLVLTVSNRRLLSVSDASESIRAATDPEDFAGRAMARLRAMLEHANSVTLDVARGTTPEAAASRISCSVRLLADAAGLAVFRQHGGAGAGGFIETTKALAHAWLQFDASRCDPQSDGPDHLIGPLEAVARHLQDGGVPFLPESQFRLQRSNCLLLPMDDDWTLVVAVADSTRLMALIPAQEQQVILENWQKTEMKGPSTGRACPPKA
jgi:hypothetical protein